MADDFADNVSTPVVHVQWWGSYLQGIAGTGVKEFLVAFESDVPAGANGQPSHPGTILSSQIVTLGALAPGSGTFTEAALPNLGSQTAAVVSILPSCRRHRRTSRHVFLAEDRGDRQSLDRWTNLVGLASSRLVDSQHACLDGAGRRAGEHVAGIVTPGVSVNHFQDDAVAGTIGIGPITTPIPGPISPSLIDQAIGTPQNYVVPFDGPADPGASRASTRSRRTWRSRSARACPSHRASCCAFWRRWAPVGLADATDTAVTAAR